MARTWLKIAQLTYAVKMKPRYLRLWLSSHESARPKKPAPVWTVLSQIQSAIDLKIKPGSFRLLRKGRHVVRNAVIFCFFFCYPACLCHWDLPLTFPQNCFLLLIVRLLSPLFSAGVFLAILQRSALKSWIHSGLPPQVLGTSSFSLQAATETKESCVGYYMFWILRNM